MDYQAEANCPLIQVAAKINLALVRNETLMSCNIVIFKSFAGEKSAEYTLVSEVAKKLHVFTWCMAYTLPPAAGKAAASLLAYKPFCTEGVFHLSRKRDL